MNNGAAIVAAPASRLRRGPPASTDTDRPVHTVAIAIVMQSVHAGQTNRHAVAVRADIGTGKERRDKPATRSNPARGAVVRAGAAHERKPSLVIAHGTIPCGLIDNINEWHSF